MQANLVLPAAQSGANVRRVCWKVNGGSLNVSAVFPATQNTYALTGFNGTDNVTCYLEDGETYVVGSTTDTDWAPVGNPLTFTAPNLPTFVACAAPTLDPVTPFQ